MHEIVESIRRLQMALAEVGGTVSAIVVDGHHVQHQLVFRARQAGIVLVDDMDREVSNVTINDVRILT